MVMQEALTLTFVPDEGTGVTGDVYRFIPRFRVTTATGEHLSTISTELTRSAATMIENHLPEEGRDALLQQALLRFGVRQLQQELEDPATRNALLAEQEKTWTLNVEAVEDLLALCGDKTCAYQEADGPDLLCLAAAPNDETVIGVSGRRRVAPTSQPLCAACAMPDATVVCSQFSHPQVLGIEDMDGLSRQLTRALCNLSRGEIEQPGGCQAGGHDCWQRIVRLESAAPPDASHPRALAEILDALDAWWRLGVANKPLLRLQGATSITGLALPCTSRAEFTDRLSELAAVLGSLRVDDEEVRPGLDQGEELPHKDQSLNRIRACLKGKITDNDSLERVNLALARLRRLQRIRSTLQHPESHDELVQCVAALGITWPPTDWVTAWERVRAEAADALAKLRDELRDQADRAT